MAEIPVEHKEKSSGFPWWLIPLLLLLLLLPLLYFCNRNTVVDNTNVNTNRTVVTTNANSGSMTNANSGAMMSNANNVGVVANSNLNSNANGGSGAMTNSSNSSSNSTASNGQAITDVNYFGGATDQTTLVGRSANYTGVRVNRVLSDRVFTVKSGASEMFVMLDENLDSGGGKEQQIKIRPGQNINLTGSFRAVPNAETKDEQQRDLNKAEYAQMKNQKIYLHATTVADAK